MGRRSKSERKTPLVRGVLARNLVYLRDRVYSKARSPTARNHRLAKDAETTLSQIQRIIAEELGPGIDMVERLADALKVRPQDMLTPYLAVQVPGPDSKDPGADRELQRRASG